MSEDEKTYRGDALFERDSTDDPIPYTIISNELIRCKSMTPACRWLIMYLLSHAPGWVIRMSQLKDHLREHMGRDAVSNLIKQALESGYLTKVHYLEKNLSRFKYVISGTPKFKKSLRNTNPPPPEIPHSEEESVWDDNTDSQEMEMQEAGVGLDIRINKSLLRKDKELLSGGAQAPVPPLNQNFLYFGKESGKQRVRMLMTEYEKLVEKYGKELVHKKLEALDEYADIKPKEFKSYGKHYSVINNWCRREGIARTNAVASSLMPPRFPLTEAQVTAKNAQILSSLKKFHPGLFVPRDKWLGPKTKVQCQDAFVTTDPGSGKQTLKLCVERPGFDTLEGSLKLWDACFSDQLEEILNKLGLDSQGIV